MKLIAAPRDDFSKAYGDRCSSASHCHDVRRHRSANTARSLFRYAEERTDRPPMTP